MVLISLSLYWEQSIHLSWLSRTVFFFFSFNHTQAQSESREEKSVVENAQHLFKNHENIVCICVLLMLVIPIPFNSCDVMWCTGWRVAKSKRSSSGGSGKKPYTHSKFITRRFRAHTHNRRQHIAIPSISMYVYVIVSVLSNTHNFRFVQRKDKKATEWVHVCVCMCTRESERIKQLSF